MTSYGPAARVLILAYRLICDADGVCVGYGAKGSWRAVNVIGAGFGRTGTLSLNAVVLLTGLPSSGKSTLARRAHERLLLADRPAEVLDGDEVRRQFWPELTLSSADRSANLARIAALSALLARNGVLVLAAAIAPYSDDRKAMRVLLEDSGLQFHEVHVATPLEVCVERDVKGLYARQRRGEISQLTGVDAVYEVPAAPELTIDTSRMRVEDSVSVLLKGVLGDTVESAFE